MLVGLKSLTHAIFTASSTFGFVTFMMPSRASSRPTSASPKREESPDRLWYDTRTVPLEVSRRKVNGSEVE